jgi:DNA-binding LacI/PurR family transcriptional regulator
MTTIKDIARALEVAPSTVARALNNHPHISDQTKSRVQATAQQLGYIANSAARSMRSRASTLIGFVVPDVEHNDLGSAAKALAECCNDAGFQMVLSLTEDDPTKEYAHLLALASARVAGIAIVPTASPLRESVALLKRLPCVQLLRRIDALASDWFALDDEFGIYEATRHLAGLGHRRIAYLGGLTKLSTGEARLRAYRRALADADLAYDKELAATISPLGIEANKAFRGLYKAHKPSAVVLGAPLIAIGALEAIGELGLRVPDDLSVTGFGDQAWMKGWGPGLTTIRTPVRDLALAGGSFLLRRISDKASSPSQRSGELTQALHRPSLIVRGSTAAPLDKL